MKMSAVAGAVATLLIASTCRAQLPEMPGPAKEHEWLAQLVGEWETEAEAVFEPDQPPLKCKGTESIRAIGGFWVLSEMRGTMPGTNIPTTGLLTLGYDAEKKKYVGTWVDSMTGHLWTYEGTLDETGKKLTLLTEGPNPVAPGTTAKYRESIEIKGPDHKVFTSAAQGEDGEWHTFMTSHARRKK
jgi:hypothetical protein